jgi:hypothetical protein
MLKALQHNVGKCGEALHCLLETAKERKADLVIIQEPPVFAGYAHPSFDLLWQHGGRVMTARKRDSDWTFTAEDNLSRDSLGDVQVIAAGLKGVSERKIRIANAYFQKVGRDGRERPAEKADWNDILSEDCILAGDFNAHSPRWNPHCMQRRDHVFLEDLIDIHGLVVKNNDQETRPNHGSNMHSIIDLTLTTPEVAHRLERWEILSADQFCNGVGPRGD